MGIAVTVLGLWYANMSRVAREPLLGRWKMHQTRAAMSSPTSSTTILEFRPDGTGTQMTTGMEKTRIEFVYSVSGDRYSQSITDDASNGEMNHYTFWDRLSPFAGLTSQCSFNVTGNMLTFRDRSGQGGITYDRLSRYDHE